MLDQVPFAALHDGSKFLIERCGVSTAPSLGVLAGCKARLQALGARQDAGWLIVSNPTQEEELAPLDKCAVAAAAELGLAAGKHLGGAAAVAEDVLALLREKSHALFMCHGITGAKAQVPLSILLPTCMRRGSVRTCLMCMHPRPVCQQ